MATVKKDRLVEIVGSIENAPIAEVVSSEPSGLAGIVAWLMAGYSNAPLRIDPVGTTVQPVYITGGGGSGGTSSTFGQPFPSLGTAAGAKDTNGNMAALNLDASGNLKVTGGSSGNVTIVNPVDGSGYVQVDVETWNAGTLSVDITNSSIPVTQSGSWTVAATQSGSWSVSISGTPTVNQGTSPWVTADEHITKNLNQDASGNVGVNVENTVTITGSVTVSGTVTANQGTSPWVVSGTVTSDQGGAPWTVKPDGTAWTFTGTSANVDVTNTVTVTGTVAVTQSTSPWVTADEHITKNLNQDGSGNVGVNVENTVTITGTITANQGTSPWVVSGTVSLGSGSATVGAVLITDGTNDMGTMFPWGTIPSASPELSALPVNAAAWLQNEVLASYISPTLVQNQSTVLSSDLSGNVRVRIPYVESALGDLVAVPRHNQVAINFSTVFDPNLITNTVTGTGSATQANGCATYASGTTSGGEATGVSVQSLVYHCGYEWFAFLPLCFLLGVQDRDTSVLVLITLLMDFICLMREVQLT